MRILLIESRKKTGIEELLVANGHVVPAVDTGEEGIDLAQVYDHDAVIVDLDLADMTGFEVIRAIRMNSKVPVIVVSAKTDSQTCCKALGHGADDFIRLPYDKDELLARVSAVVRRSQGHAKSIVVTGELVVDLDAKTVELAGQRVHLTSKEYGVLEIMSLRKGSTISKELFLDHLYGHMDEPEIKIIDVFICKIRKKLMAVPGCPAGGYIQTVWGRGYTLSTEVKDEKPAIAAAPAPLAIENKAA